MTSSVTYHINWIKSVNYIVKSHIAGILISSISMIGGSAYFLYLHYASDGSLIKIMAILSFWVIFCGTLLVGFIRSLMNYKKYSFMRKITIYEDRFIYYTPRGYKFVVKFENIGLINMAERNLSYGKYYPFTTVNILYYNEKLNRCILILIERKVGLKVVEKYKEYVESKGLKPCPIITGDLKSYAEVEVPIKKLKKSPFCRRR